MEKAKLNSQIPTMEKTMEKAKLNSQIEKMAEECSIINWDGYGAYPIGPQAVKHAKEFIRAIPDTIELPDYSPSPDGSVSLEWIFDRKIMISISVGYNNILAYAWLNNDEHGHGTIKFDGKVPEEIINRILLLKENSKKLNSSAIL